MLRVDLMLQDAQVIITSQALAHHYMMMPIVVWAMNALFVKWYANNLRHLHTSIR